MSNTTGNGTNKSVACGNKAQKLPESVQFAIITALPNIVNGAFWGFEEVKKCREYGEALKGDKNVILRKLYGGDAALVEVNPDYLLKAVSLVDGSLITEKDIAAMREGIAEGCASFEKFLMKNADKNFRSQVGIYCINDSTAITYKGTAYPAFRVDIRTALNLMNKWGYLIGVAGKMVTPQEAMHAGGKLFESMMLSPTNTGVFITVSSTWNEAQVSWQKSSMALDRKKKCNAAH